MRIVCKNRSITEKPNPEAVAQTCPPGRLASAPDFDRVLNVVQQRHVVSPRRPRDRQ